MKTDTDLGHVASPGMPKSKSHLCSHGWLSSSVLGILVVCYFRTVIIQCRIIMRCLCTFGDYSSICLIFIDLLLLDFSSFGNEGVRMRCISFVSIALHVDE